MQFLLCLLVFFSLSCGVAAAQNVVPPTHPLKEVESELKVREKHEEELKAELQNIKSGINSKQKEMVKIAGDIKNNEKKLTVIENRISLKEKEQITIEDRLTEDRAAISDLILAMERMRRIPPEALLAKPGVPMETAQSAMLLESILPRVHKRAEGLKTDIKVLGGILEDLKKDRETVIKTSEKLETNQKKLASLLNERESLYNKTSEDVRREQAELKRISEQATNLRDLVARIEKKQEEEDQRYQQAAATSVTAAIPSPRSRTPVPNAGQAQLPISGFIKTDYGKADEIGAVSKGIKIEGRKNALVVAPMGGVVDYAGAFKGYGQIIILKHEKGYHSLIAGLGKIDTVVGRAVAAGEPIGSMGQGVDAQDPVLYYELRYKGNPVHPSQKIAGLK